MGFAQLKLKWWNNFECFIILPCGADNYISTVNVADAET